MSIDIAYIAASTNRHPQAADISPTSLVAFGSSNLIALWNIPDENDRGVSETLPGHEGLVTCVCFSSDAMFTSTDDKGILMCWRKQHSQWKSTGKTQAHANPISSLCVHDDWIVTGSSDGSAKIWRIVPTGEESDELIETQVLPLRGRYPLALALTHLPQSKVAILAIGGTDSKIQIWTRSENVFVHSAVLSGHEDWVRSLAFLAPPDKGQPLILASGSQDATIRLWNIEAWHKDTSALSDELLDAFEASLGDLGDADEGGRQISLKRHILSVKSDQGRAQQYSITFDALLIGHEAGVTSLAWRPTSTSDKPLTLLSTSTDSSLILWSPSAVLTPSHDGSTSIWINRQRFGDIGGQRLGGFVGCIWAQEGKDALAWGWAGGWRRWSCNASGNTESDEIWAEAGAIGGHSGPVKCLDWCPTGEYLISTGLDQTSRIHGTIPSAETTRRIWHELGRPQVHGYDLVGVSFLDPLRFASIADEKVIRVFEAPRGFVDMVEALGVLHFPKNEKNRPVGASVPPLGLSNKAVAEVTPGASALDLPKYRRPFEGELASSTLWPEVEKVFGHGYESATLAVSHSRRLMATACRATTAEHAVVRVYDAENYLLVGQPLEGHSLTVTKIAFSPDDRLVLTVSRDRSWRLYEVQEAGGFAPIAADKTHGRIIWDCGWACEGDVFATASRDKTVKIWQRGEEGRWKAQYTIKTTTAATAVDFSAADPSQHRRRLAIGLETGEILIYSGSRFSAANWKHDTTIPSRLAHVGHIHRLAWRSGSSAELASCSEDGTLKVSIVQAIMD